MAITIQAPAIANKSLAVTASDDGAVADARYMVGFIPNIDGNFEGQLSKDSSDRTFFVLGGLVYPLHLKDFTLTGATGVTELTILYNIP